MGLAFNEVDVIYLLLDGNVIFISCNVNGNDALFLDK